MASLNVNADALVKYANALEKIKKSALPVAVRGALNNAAFDVKQNTMPAKAAATFVQRSPKFFIANSKVQMAAGFEISKMTATVGFVENKLVNQSTNFAVKDLQQQEDSGQIKGRAFIPTLFARKGNNQRGLVKPNLQLRKIKNSIVDASKIAGNNDRQKYILAAKSAGVGGFVLYKNMLYKVKSLKAKSKVERIPIYSVKKSRSVNVHATGFMRTASVDSSRKLEGYFVEQAKKQIEKLYF